MNLTRQNPQAKIENLYSRIVRLADTDAAGVVYFNQVLQFCHEAYEDSLAKFGINLQEFVSNKETAFPIVHASVDFLRPMFCGDRLVIQLTAQQLSDNEFELLYQIIAADTSKTLATAKTKHVCINPGTRQRIPVPEQIQQWLDCKI